MWGVKGKENCECEGVWPGGEVCKILNPLRCCVFVKCLEILLSLKLDSQLVYM